MKFYQRTFENNFFENIFKKAIPKPENFGYNVMRRVMPR